MRFQHVLALLLIGLLHANAAVAEDRVLDPKLYHLRVGAKPEWSDFAALPDAASLVVNFRSEANDSDWTLRLRQLDVRLTWKVLLNGKEIGKLLSDENDTILYLPIPRGAVRAGKNTLTIEQVGKASDDIRVGAITLDDRPVEKVLNEATVEIEVREIDRVQGRCPCRLTVLNADGALMTVGAKSSIEGEHSQAVRPGVIYTTSGKVRFGLPTGEYTIYAGAGFEYSVDSARIKLKAGDMLQKSLTIASQVHLKYWDCCDTHVHTLTHSGHGDCTVDERIATLAGERLDLTIVTDHNKHVDYRDASRKQLNRHYDMLVGNEVTTSFGHFNIFPVRVEDPIPDFKLKDWKLIGDSIRKNTNAKAVILNHPRDLHSGFRPFGPENFIAVSGEFRDGRVLPANAMEVVNSGAQQTDIMRLFHDWFGLLNRGVLLTPVGASDSHDVSRFIVGQGRTYIRMPYPRPADWKNVAVKSFVEGHVMVSCGLLAEITVDEKYGAGDLAPSQGDTKVAVRALGPDWVKADKVELYANGYKIREAKVKPEDAKRGAKWQGEWTLPAFKHDVHLVAIASGPGVTELYWPIAKPYQPTSPKVNRRVIGASGAVWIDADGDGKRTSANAYAGRLLRKHEPEKAIAMLANYDEAVAVQVASLLQARGVKLDMDAARKAGAHVERGFQAFTEGWRESEIARAKAK